MMLEHLEYLSTHHSPIFGGVCDIYKRPTFHHSPTALVCGFTSNSQGAEVTAFQEI